VPLFLVKIAKAADRNSVGLQANRLLLLKLALQALDFGQQILVVGPHGPVPQNCNGQVPGSAD
jgi:hypothetical protein